MRVSVIIPAYNEEEVLPLLLKDIQRQRRVKAEVIVADANSEDTTREIAASFNAEVVEGGMPAAGRNAGAAHATSEIIVFLDADVRIPRRFFARAVRQMKKLDAVVATCVARPMSRLTIDRLIHRFANFFIRINQDRDPHAPGYCIFVTREVFEKTGGFDEQIRVAEDHDFVSRASEHGPFRLLDSTYVKVNVRRFEKEGRIGYSLKAMRITLHRALFGEITDDTFTYEFGDYEEDDGSPGRKAIRRIEKALIKADRESRRVNERLLSTEWYEQNAQQAKELLAELGKSMSAGARKFFGLDFQG